MSIIRTYHDKKNPYTLLNNEALFDPQLSNGARGLWAQCMARKDDWTFYMSEMKKNTSDGKTALSNQMNELINAGYVARLQIKENMNGKIIFKRVDYIFFETKYTPEKKEEFLKEFRKKEKYCDFLETKTQEVKKELKKSLPQSGFPITETPKPENQTLINTKSKNTDKKTTTCKGNKPMKVIGKNSSSFSGKKIDGLESLGLKPNQKEQIYKSFEEEQILKGLEWLKSSKGIVDVGASLYTAIQRKYEPRQFKQSLSEKNKTYVKHKFHKFDDTNILGIRISICNTFVEFGTHIVQYDDQNFENKIKSIEKRLNL